MYNKQQDYGVKYAQITIDNFRDLGGITLTNGMVIRDNCIFRSGELHNLGEQDKAELDKLGIDYVFDLRAADEVEIKPDYVPQGAVYCNIPAVKTRGKMVINPDRVVRLIPVWLPAGMSSGAFRLRFKRYYRKFPFDNPAYRKIFEVMDEGKKFLFHCTAGKDRTGVASMLILFALGADIDTVKKDYMLSNFYRVESNEKFIRQFSEYKHYPKYRKVLTMTGNVDMGYFNVSYKKIIRRYGDIKTFLRKQYDIDDERINKWLQMYAI